MTTPNSLALHRALNRLMTEVERDDKLAGEVTRARREFLGLDRSGDDPLRQAAAEARFAEWYLLERESEVLGETPARKLIREVSSPDADLELLSSSVVGVFLVERGGKTVSLRDLQDGKLYELERPEMLELSKGDMLVGRLFVDDAGACVPSAAVASQSDAQGVAEAFRSDLASLDLGRRLSQLEIEHLLFRRLREAELASQADAVPVQQHEAELRQLLISGGKSAAFVEEFLESLRSSNQPGPVMGPALDEIAFDTDVDLDTARRLATEVWNAHHSAAAAESPPPPEAATSESSATSLGQQIARRIESGLEHHEDVEKLFEDVAEMFGEEIFDDEDDDRLTELEGTEPSPAWRGDLEPLIQEFLWEEQCGDGPEAAILRMLQEQQNEAPVPKLDLEYLEASDLMRLLLRAYLESPPEQRDQRVRQIFGVLERFYAWAERTQEYSLAGIVQECRDLFIDELDRLHRASLAMSATAEPPAGEARPTLLRVSAVDSEGFELVPTSEGEPLQVADKAAREQLRAGDLILAIPRPAGEGSATLDGMVVVLPAGAEVLMG